ncbi:hypothetical protein G6N76_09690 [Rhizobium daejeonense]|uniref:Uncharacterized protein n=1 Tax=Rhizobium daejeonense TaxID=240521 RepID=A0A6M1RYK9_9HYPH|nr:hypothetical protein [Rhizobium daejeonense]NGO63945.1 hypothetical protein [Rhizobium daejeonense]
MARPRTPRAKAAATGADKKNKGRFTERHEPEVAEDLGDPPVWMPEKQQEAWRVISAEIPWLNSSHRALVEIASYVRGRLMAGEDVGVQALNLLRQCLGQMGATPADASKAGAKPSGEEKDPADEFFD